MTAHLSFLLAASLVTYPVGSTEVEQWLAAETMSTHSDMLRCKNGNRPSYTVEGDDFQRKQLLALDATCGYLDCTLSQPVACDDQLKRARSELTTFRAACKERGIESLADALAGYLPEAPPVVEVVPPGPQDESSEKTTMPPRRRDAPRWALPSSIALGAVGALAVGGFTWAFVDMNKRLEQTDYASYDERDRLTNVRGASGALLGVGVALTLAGVGLLIYALAPRRSQAPKNHAHGIRGKFHPFSLRWSP